MYTIEYLIEHSNLPGPRANLELLYSFSRTATESQIMDCLAHIQDDTANSPEEFFGMCGIKEGSCYEKRAVVAGLCEPKLLTDEAV
ncbi:MAG: hypothetical protein GXX08_12510 [Firmicutes bacterium]|nr:hypothetical protein [Bacillota bacterium]